MTNFRDRFGPYALVTGASAGIGEEFARQLAGRGLNLVLVARRGDKLEELAAALRGVEVKVLPLDLLAPDAIATLLKETESLDIGLAVLNAGILTLGSFLDVPLDNHTNMALLNSVVPMQLAHHFGRRLVARGRGGLLFVASVAGEHPIPYEATYSASKAYTSSLGQSLRVELAREGVAVTVLAPGLVDTDMVKNAPIDVPKGPLAITGPEPVVRAALNGLGKKSIVIPGASNKLADSALRHLPRWAAVKIVGSMLGKMLTGR